jgi:hypothetical protein
MIETELIEEIIELFTYVQEFEDTSREELQQLRIQYLDEIQNKLHQLHALIQQRGQ